MMINIINRRNFITRRNVMKIVRTKMDILIVFSVRIKMDEVDNERHPENKILYLCRRYQLGERITVLRYMSNERCMYHYMQRIKTNNLMSISISR